MAKDQAQTDITDLARQTQALFKLNGTAAPQFEQVMKVQEGMLEQAETFTRHWIERRQDAVETALEALNKMNSTDKPDPAAAMQAIFDWQRGSFERLTAGPPGLDDNVHAGHATGHHRAQAAKRRGIRRQSGQGDQGQGPGRLVRLQVGPRDAGVIGGGSSCRRTTVP